MGSTSLGAVLFVRFFAEDEGSQHSRCRSLEQRKFGQGPRKQVQRDKTKLHLPELTILRKALTRLQTKGCWRRTRSPSARTPVEMRILNRKPKGRAELLITGPPQLAASRCPASERTARRAPWLPFKSCHALTLPRTLQYRPCGQSAEARLAPVFPACQDPSCR
jgi:hypothetical protein